MVHSTSLFNQVLDVVRKDEFARGQRTERGSDAKGLTSWGMWGRIFDL